MARTQRTAALVALVRALRSGTRPGEPTLHERVLALPRLLAASRSGRYDGTSSARLGALGAALLYLVSPIDLVPEAVLPLLGLMDDAVVLSWLAGVLLSETDAFLRWERGGAGSSRSRRSGGFGPQQAPPHAASPDDVVPGSVVR